MSDEPGLCVDRVLSADLVMEAARLALEENPSNVAGPPRFSPDLGVAEMASPFALAALTGSKWQNGRTLKVKFLAGEPEVRQKVVRYARLWEPHANVTFDFSDHPEAEIRVSFEPNDRS